MGMDKEISPETKKGRRRKQIIQLSVISCIVIIAFIFMIRTFSSGVSQKEIDLFVVNNGIIETTVSASGKIVPLSEEIITSPVASKILEVYKKSGDSLQKGDTLLKLDLMEAHTGMENQNNELAMKRYKLEQQKLTAQCELSEMKMATEIDEMKLQRMEVLLQNERYLDSLGASTSDQIKQVELEYLVQKKNLDQLKLRYNNLKLTSESDTRVLELDYMIASKNVSLTNKMIAEAQVRSPQNVTLVWVNDQIGSNVGAGSQLAIVANLKEFKVNAEISDSYADKVLPGNKAIVKIGKEDLMGKIGNVTPSVKDGQIQFTVILDTNNHQKLRSGLSVDVYIVHGIRDDAIRLERRAYYNGQGEYDLWVVEGDRATKKKVKLGDGSFDYVEILEGLRPGEKVIVSDMNKYRDYETLKIK